MAEIVVSIVSFVMYTADDEPGTTSDRTLVVYIHVFVAVAHCLTAAYQTPQVFGMQVIMVPAYSLVVLWKAVCAVCHVQPEEQRGCASLSLVLIYPAWMPRVHIAGSTWAQPKLAVDANAAVLHTPHLRLVRSSTISFRRCCFVYQRGLQHMLGAALSTLSSRRWGFFRSTPTPSPSSLRCVSHPRSLNGLECKTSVVPVSKCA
eukprot:SAG11_NODE_1731_length_4363_cov_4.183865_3_plen_204_part_00